MDRGKRMEKGKWMLLAVREDSSSRMKERTPEEFEYIAAGSWECDPVPVPGVCTNLSKPFMLKNPTFWGEKRSAF